MSRQQTNPNSAKAMSLYCKDEISQESHLRVFETHLYVHTGTVFSRHHAALAQKWGESEKICRIAKIAEYVEEHEVKR